VANLIVAQMLFLSGEDPDKDVHLYINSPGGSISAGLAIYDTMQFIKNKVEDHLHRPSGQHGRVSALGRHQRASGLPAQLKDFSSISHPWAASAAKPRTSTFTRARFSAYREITNNIIAKHTDQPLDRIEHDVERDSS